MRIALTFLLAFWLVSNPGTNTTYYLVNGKRTAAVNKHLKLNMGSGAKDMYLTIWPCNKWGCGTPGMVHWQQGRGKATVEEVFRY